VPGRQEGRAGKTSYLNRFLRFSNSRTYKLRARSARSSRSSSYRSLWRQGGKDKGSTVACRVEFGKERKLERLRGRSLESSV
jgi:GTPase SAR1 family protein